MIVKVQRSISTNLPNPMVLIYNESRTVEYQTELTDEMAEWFPENVYKIYCKATLKDTIINLDKVVRDRSW